MISYRTLFKEYSNKYKQSGLNTRFVLDIFQYYLNKEINPYILDELDCNVNLLKYWKISKALNKVFNGMPVEHITHRAYFYGLDLYVNKDVLIPRDETEELVEWVLKDNSEEKLNVVDLCCGSGCIGIALNKIKSNWNITGIDISNKALKVCKKNNRISKTNVNFIRNDLLSDYNKPIDVIVSNPPYIYVFDKEVSLSVRKYEPSIALFVKDEDGIEMYKKIFDQLENIDFKRGYFEIGYNQRKVLEELLKNYDYKYEFRKDINNHDRMLKIEKAQ